MWRFAILRAVTLDIRVDRLWMNFILLHGWYASCACVRGLSNFPHAAATTSKKNVQNQLE